MSTTTAAAATAATTATAANDNKQKPSPFRSILAGATAGAVEIGEFSSYLSNL